MGRRRRELPPTLGLCFTESEAYAVGVSRDQLRHSSIQRVFPRVYVDLRLAERDLGAAAWPSMQAGAVGHLPAADGWKRRQVLRAEAFQKIMRPHEFFSGRTAAVILGLPVPAAVSENIEVASIAPHRPRRIAGVRPRQITVAPSSLRHHRGFRLASPATVWAVLASELKLHDLVALGDALLYRDRMPRTEALVRAPHTTRAELAEEFRQGRRRGARMAREALPLPSPHSASAPESHLRLKLREWGFPSPTLDHDVYSETGRFLGCSEITYPEFRIAFEYEGDHHRVSKQQWNRDIEKSREYSAADWLTLRVTAQLLYAGSSKLRAITATALQSRGWNP